ncbi:MAG: hypothetical protein ACOC93_04190 [Planctomycetota bacterium]
MVGAIGRIGAALVFSDGGEERAVCTEVTAAIRGGGRTRLRWAGALRFEDRTARHVRRSVVGAVDRILRALGREGDRYDVSVRTVGAAALLERDVEVAGYSTDLPLSLALLSASLELPIPRDVLATGHLGSLAGQIMPVRSLGAKLEAAAGAFGRVLYPRPSADRSAERLAPQQLLEMLQSLEEYRDRMELVAVSSMAEAIERLWPRDVRLTAALQGGYIDADGRSEEPAGQAARRLLAGGHQGLWDVLSGLLLRQETSRARSLLTTWMNESQRTGVYPCGAGRKLLAVIESLPPDCRTVAWRAELLTVEQCLQLGRLAGREDQQDVPLLFAAVQTERAAAAADPAPPPSVCTSPHAKLRRLTQRISEGGDLQRLTQRVDVARSAYPLGRVLLEGPGEFEETVTSFYLHLLRHCYRTPATVSREEAAPEAHHLVSRAYEREGGWEAALAEATSATNGGLRAVLDAMADQFKRDQRRKQIEMQLRRHLDGESWSGRVALVAAIQEALGPAVGGSLSDKQPEELAARCDDLLRRYVAWLDALRAEIRSL